MFQEMIGLLTKKGKRDLILSSIFFAFYGMCAICTIVIVFLMLFKIKEGISVKDLYCDFAALTGLVVFKGICNMMADLKKHNAGFDIVQQIREKMIVKLKLFSLGFYTDERLGEINTVLSKDVNNMEQIVGHVFSRMFGDFLLALIVLTGLLFLDVKLAIIMSLSVPAALLFLFFSIKKAGNIEHENNSALADMASLFVEYVRGISVIKSFSNNRVLTEELKNKTKEFGITSKRASRFKAKQLSLFGFLLDAGYFLLLLYGGMAVINGTADVFTFIIFAVVSRGFYKPFASMEMHYMYYISGVDSYKRLGKILYADAIPDNRDGIVPDKNDISFENVDFSYEKDEFQIKGLNFYMEENRMTALAGESGSGKTTITNLLLRFYEVDKGSIKIGGVDIRDIPYDELLDKISIVMQNVQLFDNTIEENIKVGKKGATKEEIMEAAKKARIHDYIMGLPEAYQSHIGENGGLLSGGQRQRISIARAFLKDSPILVLDEMTSNVDPVNESLIQDAITELSRNRTVLVIAHHLKTIKEAGQILVFKNGRLVEQGCHSVLMDNKAYYYKLWQAQYGVS